jgi:hypothetical protein
METVMLRGESVHGLWKLADTTPGVVIVSNITGNEKQVLLMVSDLSYTDVSHD